MTDEQSIEERLRKPGKNLPKPAETKEEKIKKQRKKIEELKRKLEEKSRIQDKSPSPAETIPESKESKTEAYLGKAIDAWTQGGKIKWLKRALEEDPNHYKAREFLGMAYYMKGWYDSAIKELEPLTGRDPKCSNVFFFLSGAYMRKDRLNDALEAARKTVSLSPDNSTYHARLSEIYLGLGKYEQARQEAEEAIKISKWFSTERSNAKQFLKTIKHKMGLPARVLGSIGSLIERCDKTIKHCKTEDNRFYTNQDKVPPEIRKQAYVFLSDAGEIRRGYESCKRELESLRGTLLGKGPDEAQKLIHKVDLLGARTNSLDEELRALNDKARKYVKGEGGRLYNEYLARKNAGR